MLRYLLLIALMGAVPLSGFAQTGHSTAACAEKISSAEQTAKNTASRNEGPVWVVEVKAAAKPSGPVWVVRAASPDTSRG